MNTGLIRESFEAIKPHAQEVIEHFYGELFDRHPQAKPLFQEVKMEKQQRALVNSLAHIVEFLEDGPHLTDYLRKMGGRHTAYGTKPEHYGWVSESLLATLSYYFDAQWTPELSSSWATALKLISAEMIAGMKQTSGRVVGIPSTDAKPEPSLSSMAQSIVQELVKKALEAELGDGAFQTAVRTKAQELLRNAIETEARELLAQARGDMRSA